MSRRRCPSASAAFGFTLIEVIGALVIFSVGVLMVIRLSSVFGLQMRYAGARSELVAFANERLDSLEAEPFASISPGMALDTLVVEGISYQRAVTVTSVTPVLAKIDVSLVPVGGGGPSHAVTSYVSAVW